MSKKLTVVRAITMKIANRYGLSSAEIAEYVKEMFDGNTDGLVLVGWTCPACGDKCADILVGENEDSLPYCENCGTELKDYDMRWSDKPSKAGVVILE